MIKNLYKNEIAVESVSKIHLELLAESPIATLGLKFMSEFYYSRLVYHHLIHTAYYDFNNKCAGFIAYTEMPQDFMLLGIKKNFFSLCKTLVKIILHNPEKIVEIINVIKIMHNRKIEGYNRNEGEILSFAVLPEYRSIKFIRKEKKKIAYELFQYAVERLKEKECKKIRMMVQPDNIEALLFYHGIGCEIKKEGTGKDSVYVINYNMSE